MRWEEIARRQAGLVTRDQLVAGGASPSAIESMCRSGRLERRSLAVFMVAGAPLTFQARIWGAVLGTDGIAAFRTGAFLWGMVDRPGDAVEVIGDVSRRTRWRIEGVRVHRVQLLPRDRSDRAGVPVTSRTCTALDFLGRQPRPQAVQFADRALQCGWITRSDIEVRVHGQKGRTGNGRLREILDRTGDRAAAESERVLHRLLDAAGLPDWTANLPVWINGELAIVDVGWPALRLGIEIDGMAYHVDAERFQRDRRRQNRLVGGGWTILRFTWADLHERPDHVVTTIRTTRSRILCSRTG